MRFFRRFLAGTVAVALSSAALLPAGAANAQGDDVIEDLARCLAGPPHRLLAAVVLDESASLQETDPDAARVVGAEVVIRQLAQLASTRLSDDTQPKIEVLIAGFHGAFETVSDGWVPLNKASEESLASRIRDFSDRDDGLDTDFWYGLNGVEAELSKRTHDLAAQGEPTPCMVYFLFTDGEYSIDDLGGKQAYSDLEVTRENVPSIIREGQRAICGPGGIADNLRSLGAIPIVVSLSDGSFDPRLITDLALDRGSCQGDPDEEFVGLYEEATNPGALITTFDELVHRLSGWDPGGGNEKCDEVGVATVCTRTFEVDDSISRFHLLVRLGSPAVRIRIAGPKSDRETGIATTSLSSANAGPVRLHGRRLSETAFSLDAQRPRNGEGWSGSWAIKFIDPQGNAADSQIFLYGDLVPSFERLPEFRLGSTVPIQVSIVRRTGEPVPPADFVADADLTVTVTDPATGEVERVPMSPLANGFRGDYSVHESLKASKLNLEAALAVTTSTGISLTPTRIATSVDVLPPVGFPSARLMPSVLPKLEVNGEATERTEGNIVITGPKHGSGCVWFPSASFEDIPPESDVPKWQIEGSRLDESSCLPVRSGQTVRLPVVFEPGESTRGSGQVAGFLVSSSKSSDSGETLEQHLEFSFPLDVHPPSTLWWIVAALVGAALGLPLAFLAISNYFSARFDAPTPLRGAVVNVRVENGRVTRIAGDGTAVPLRIEPTEYQTVLTSPHKQKRFSWSNLSYTARAPKNPFRAPWGQVSGSYVIGSEGAIRSGPESSARVPLTLPGSWVLRFSSAEQKESAEEHVATGTLHSLISAESVAFEQIARLIEAVQEQGPAHLESFAASQELITEGNGGQDQVPDTPSSRTPEIDDGATDVEIPKTPDY